MEKRKDKPTQLPNDQLMQPRAYKREKLEICFEVLITIDWRYSLFYYKFLIVTTD